MKNLFVRGSAIAAVGALVSGALLIAPAAQAAPLAKPAGADPSAATLGAAYLAAQPGADGIIVSHSSYQGTQYDTPSPGITIDAAVSLDAVGGQAATVARMAAGVEASTYATGSAGAAAKFAAFEYTLGRTSAALPTAVSKVNSSIAAAPRNGRLEDATNDFESPLTQAYAVKALHDAGASRAGDALSFLLTQQCPAGYFRSDFSAKASASQGCDPADANGSAPSADTTAFAVLQLQDQKSTPAVATSLASAVTWLAGQQGADGSYAGNANTTGLAAWALGVSGRTDLATKAAGWLRAHQLVNAGTCTPYAAATNGALVVDDLGLVNAKAAPLDQNDNSTATYATSQALPGLLWAAGGTKAGETTLTAPQFARAGSAQSVTIAGAPGDTICASAGGAATRIVLPASGTATYPVTLPATTGPVSVTTTDAGGEVDVVKVTALAATTYLLDAKSKTVRRGGKVVVKITGAPAGETLTGKFAGKKVTKVVKADGTARFKFKATKLGKKKVKVVGQYADRKGTTRITVRR